MNGPINEFLKLQTSFPKNNCSEYVVFHWFILFLKNKVLCNVRTEIVHETYLFVEDTYGLYHQLGCFGIIGYIVLQFQQIFCECKYILFLQSVFRGIKKHITRRLFTFCTRYFDLFNLKYLIGLKKSFSKTILEFSSWYIAFFSVF